MSRGAQTFKQGDVTKAVKAVTKAGYRVTRVEITDGRIVVHIAESDDTKPVTSEWD
jgi:hypothetical protein